MRLLLHIPFRLQSGLADDYVESGDAVLSSEMLIRAQPGPTVRFDWWRAMANWVALALFAREAVMKARSRSLLMGR